MAKSKDTVSISKNGRTKEIPSAQWKAMKDKNSTYGWSLSSELSKEIEEKDKSLEGKKITELEGKVKTLSEENETLKESIVGKDKTITELEGKVKTLETKVFDLTPQSPGPDKTSKTQAKNGNSSK